MVNNFIFIHSTGGHPEECWYPWLEKKIVEKGFDVFIPQFPTPEGQTLDNWMDIFKPYLKEMDENTIIIGRSIGVPFILRVLEKLYKPIKASFLVAGFCSDLHMDEFKPYVDSFIEQPFDWKKIKKNAGKLYIYHSEDDTIVDIYYGKELAEKLQSELILIEEGGHFNLDSRFAEKFEKILEDIKPLI